MRRGVALELGFGNAGRLEIELVEESVVRLGHRRRRPGLAARPERHAEPDHAAEAVRTQQRRVPGDRRAPIVPGDHRRLGTERVEQADHVADEMEERVLLDLLRRVGLPVAAHVRRHGMEAGFGEGAELVAPRIPAFRKAVAEHDERARPGFGDVHADAVGLDRTVSDLGHVLSLPARQAPAMIPLRDGFRRSSARPRP